MFPAFVSFLILGLIHLHIGALIEKLIVSKQAIFEGMKDKKAIQDCLPLLVGIIQVTSPTPGLNQLIKTPRIELET